MELIYKQLLLQRQIYYRDKAYLETKFKCLCITMCSLVMSPFSGDFIKTEIE